MTASATTLRYANGSSKPACSRIRTSDGLSYKTGRRRRARSMPMPPCGRPSNSGRTCATCAGRDDLLMPSSSNTIGALEQHLRDSAEADLPTLALADDVSGLLVEVIRHLPVPPRTEESKPADHRRHALW